MATDGRAICQRKLAGRIRKPISVTLDPRLVKDIDSHCEDLGCTRSMIIELVLRRELLSVMEDVRKMIVGRDVMREILGDEEDG